MLRAGIIGCGRIGCGFDDDPRRGYVSSHAGAYRRTPGMSLVALADLDPSKVAKYGDRFAVEGRYTDYERMLEEADLDIVSVCTWNHTHEAIIERAVAAGVKAVFCEKPIADSLDGADRIVRLCEREGVVLLIDHMRRFDPFHQDIAAFLRAGRLGRIQQVTVYYTAGLANTGSHVIDLLRFYFGDAVWAQGLASVAPSPNPRDPNVDGWIWFDQGFGAALQACDVKSYLVLELHILGTAGRLRVLSSGFDVAYESVGDSPRFVGYHELRPSTSPIDTERPHEFMLDAMTHLLACVEGRAVPLCGGRDARAALELICALRESAAEDGRRIPLPLLSSSITVQSQ